MYVCGWSGGETIGVREARIEFYLLHGTTSVGFGLSIGAAVVTTDGEDPALGSTDLGAMAVFMPL